MKKILLLFMMIYINSLGQVLNTELLGHIDPITNGNAKHYSDIWGYADSTGGEYALIDGYSGVFIVNVTVPANPEVVTFIDGPTSIWRDIKTHDHYAYFVSEGGTEGLQIVDLSGLPDSAKLVKNDSKYFQNAHNIFIDNGFAYVIGSDNGGGMHILDLTNPLNPVETAYYSQSGYIHDVYVWNDTVVACAADSYDLVDVTDKSNPQKISESDVLPGIYAHSGWMTEDKRYFFAAEEFNVRDMIIFDLIDRTDWKIAVPEFQLPSDARIHNIFIKGNYAICSYYEAGLVIFDISDPLHPLLAGQYDTYPTDNGTFNGVWGTYPYLPSGNIILSDQDKGLYIVKFLGGDTPPGILYSQNSSFIQDTGPQIISSQFVDNSSITDARLYFRTSKNNNTSEWISITDTNGADSNYTYEFEIPGQAGGTTVEYYFAAADDSGNVVTLPSGGSGTNPAGNIPPQNFFAYTVVTSVPQITLVTPDIRDTTIARGELISFHAEAIDTSGLEVKLRWFVNSVFRLQKSDYLYTSAFGAVPRVDTVKLIATNGFLAAEREWIVHVEEPTSVDDEMIVNDFKLEQNYPNPFNPSTTIRFTIPNDGFVSLTVYNSLGQKVADLIKDYIEKGRHSIHLNAKEFSSMTSGVYFYKLTANGITKTNKMILMK